MNISVRTLLALSDPACEPGFRNLLEKRIRTGEDQEEVKRFIHRVQKIQGIPLRSPEWIDGREELDPNCVAEYLDHKLSAEEESRFESLILSSDVFLAEVAGVSSILNHSLGQAVEIPDELRTRLYEIRRQEVLEPVPEPIPAPASTAAGPLAPSTEKTEPEALRHYRVEKKLKESLEEWKWERLNHIKNIVVLSVFLSVGLLVWTNRDTINQFPFVREKQEPAETFPLSASHIEAVPPQTVLDSVEWKETEMGLPFYTKLESPESILKKTAPKPLHTPSVPAVFQTNEIRPAAL